MGSTDVVMLVAESHELLLILAFVMVTPTASYTAIGLQLGRFRVHPVAFVAVMRRTPELLHHGADILDRLTSVV
jgi:hypothetical protein